MHIRMTSHFCRRPWAPRSWGKCLLRRRRHRSEGGILGCRLGCITATTAVATTVLEGLGYEPKATVLSVPVTFASLSNGDIDAFLGLWLPTQQSMIDPYFNDGTIENVAVNLEGAKYTLAVPTYVYEAGVKTFGDIAAHADKFDSKFYGIEPGNDGNQIIQGMIDEDAFGLSGFEVVESSEQGMLSQVEAAVRATSGSFSSAGSRIP